VTHDVEESSRRLATLEEIADGLLPVVLRGVSHQWFALWDRIIQNLGVEEAMLDLVQNPELIHELMKRMRDAWMSRLDQLEAQGLLATNHENERVGSGGYAYSSQVPSQGFDPGHIRPIDQWGCGNAQIFAGVSPAMHEEFSLQYERPWLARFGLVYYGCCEQLHDRLHLLESVRNLRKVSASPWADKQSMRELCLGRYVISVKPSPAVFAEDTYSEDVAERDLRRDLDATRGANVEVVLKDISTVRGDPSRLFRWADMASRVVKEYEA
jgi:hypothetical protein